MPKVPERWRSSRAEKKVFLLHPQIEEKRVFLFAATLKDDLGPWKDTKPIWKIWQNEKRSLAKWCAWLICRLFKELRDIFAIGFLGHLREAFQDQNLQAFGHPQCTIKMMLKTNCPLKKEALSLLAFRKRLPERRPFDSFATAKRLGDRCIFNHSTFSASL